MSKLDSKLVSATNLDDVRIETLGVGATSAPASVWLQWKELAQQVLAERERSPEARREALLEETREELQVPYVLELKLVVSVTPSDVPALREMQLELASLAREQLGRTRREKRKLYFAGGDVRPLTQEELLAVLPRKVHLRTAAGRWACTTAHVSPRNLTDDRAAVTCKLCQAVIAGWDAEEGGDVVEERG